MRLLVKNTDELKHAAAQILQHNPDKRLFAFYGEMGAGKTTLIKKMCEALGVNDATSSPTFSLVNEYKTTSGDTVFHFDFYRIKSNVEALEMGYEEYLYSGRYCFIEWPEKLENLLPQECSKVSLKVLANNEREIQLN